MRALGGEDEVARRRQPHAAAGHAAVNQRDDDARCDGEAPEEAEKWGAPRRRIVGRRLLTGGLLEIHPGAEDAVRALDDDQAAGRPALGLVECGVQLRQHGIC